MTPLPLSDFQDKVRQVVEKSRGTGKHAAQNAVAHLQMARAIRDDCRHSAATMQLEAGIDMKVVQENLGHASIAITADIYSHVRDRLRCQAADQYEAHRNAAGTPTGTKQGQKPDPTS